MNFKLGPFLIIQFLQCTYLQLLKFCFLGVFVITHISTCRNGTGYCVLGFSCEVDEDFTKDDLGGNCNGLGAAFNPNGIYIYQVCSSHSEGQGGLIAEILDQAST